jgi:capsular polysaccharide biosynthesis protein
MSQVDLESQNTQTNVTVVKSASVPTQAASPSMWRNVSLGVLGGAILAMLVAFARELLSPRLLTRRDVEVDLNLPLMAELPRVKSIAKPSGASAPVLTVPASFLHLTR